MGGRTLKANRQTTIKRRASRISLISNLQLQPKAAAVLFDAGYISWDNRKNYVFAVKSKRIQHEIIKASVSGRGVTEIEAVNIVRQFAPKKANRLLLNKQGRIRSEAEKKKTLESLFGIWKGKGYSLAKVREEQWGK